MIIELSPRTLYPDDIIPKNCPEMLLCRFMLTSHLFQMSFSLGKLLFTDIKESMNHNDFDKEEFKITFFIEGNQLFVAPAIHSGFRVKCSSYTTVIKGSFNAQSPSLCHMVKEMLHIENKALYIVDNSPVTINSHTAYRLIKFDSNKHLPYNPAINVLNQNNENGRSLIG